MRIKTCVIGVVLGLGVALATAAWAGVAAPKGAEAYIIQPKDGAVLKSPVLVVFGLRGMGVAPAGVHKVGTGHHHLIIDEPLPDMKKPIPTGPHFVHFGGGQTEALMQFTPGKHTLQLLLGDNNHFPHNPPVVSKQITITVE